MLGRTFLELRGTVRLAGKRGRIFGPVVASLGSAPEDEAYAKSGGLVLRVEAGANERTSGTQERAAGHRTDRGVGKRARGPDLSSPVPRRYRLSLRVRKRQISAVIRRRSYLRASRSIWRTSATKLSSRNQPHFLPI